MLGLCCQYIEPVCNRNGNIKYKNILEERTLQYGQFLKNKYSKFQIEKIWINNITNLYSVLQKINSEDFHLFRVSSNLFPLYDEVSDLLTTSKEINNILQEIGKFIIRSQMRLTTHPDQFVVISSNKKDVINNSIRMLEHHAWIFDQMNLPQTPYYAINIHGGVKENNQILIDSIKKLSPSVKNRLTLENDERAYNVKDLYKIYESTGVPICWDSHHHTFNAANLSLEEGLQLAKSTWQNHKPLTHLSNTEPLLINGSFTERRKHSDYVHYIPECQIQAHNNNEIDIEFEFKMKNLAIKKSLSDFNIKMR